MRDRETPVIPLELVRQEVARHMDEILALFKAGAEITVLVRSPGYPDRDFLMTSDTPDEIVAAIRRRLEEKPSA